MRRRLLIGWTVCVALVTGCATALPPVEPGPAPDYFVRAPFDTVWQRVVSYFADSRIQIQTIDKASGLLGSTRLRFSRTQMESWIDCGWVASGESIVRKLNEMQHPPDLLANLNVLVRAAGDSTAVRINLGIIGLATLP